jgi:hypothetical protein
VRRAPGILCGRIPWVRAVPGQPGLFPESPRLVDHRQAEVLTQGQGQLAVQVVAGRVQHGGPQPGDQPGRVLVAEGGRTVGLRRQPVGQQPVVRHAVHGGDPAAVPVPLGHREADLGHHVRVQPGRALGHRDLLGPHRVAGVGGGQRVGDQVQHGAGLGPERLPAPGQPVRARDALLQQVQLAGQGRADLGLLAAGHAVQRGHGGPEPALAGGQPGQQQGPVRVGGGHPVQRPPGRVRPVDRQRERGQPLG